MRVLLVPNVANPAAVQGANDLVAYLSTGGFDPVLVADDAEACGLAECAVFPTEIGEPALVVALGGDGTILKAVHRLSDVEIPILGVNFGRLGFLSGAYAEKLRESVEAALAGEGRIERRSTLTATVTMAGRAVGTYRALNEVYVGRSAAMRIIEAELHINGTLISRLRCDGLVIATSTGSTAYSLSAGGPIVSPDVSCAVVTAISPHTLAMRPLVIGPSDRVDIALPDYARRDACVSVDGSLAPCRRDIESVSIVRGPHDVLLVKLDGREFFEAVGAEFLRG